MTERSSRTLSCSVLFLEMVDFAAQSAAAQQRQRRAFEQRLACALAPIAARERIVFDTDDGAVVTFLGDPRDAMHAARSMRAPAEPQLRMGINLGPVRLAETAQGFADIVGRGVNAARSIMRFSQPGQLLVSRSYYEVSALLRLDHVGMCQYEGARADAELGEQEIYSVAAGGPGSRPGAAHGAGRAGAADAGWLDGFGPLGLRRSALAVALAVCAVFVAGGLAIVLIRA